MIYLIFTSTFGLLRLVAFSNAKQESDAYSLDPISILKVSADLIAHIPMT